MKARPLFPVFVALCAAVLAGSCLRRGTPLGGRDAQFYYAASRSLVIDGDFDITNDLAVTRRPEAFDADGDGFMEGLPRRADGRVVNKYPAGLSLLEAPWLALGLAARRVLESRGYRFTSAPGFSSLEANAVALGLVVTFAAGAFALLARLRRYAPELWAFLALVGAWAGTSLLFYSCAYPFMTHGASFTLVVGAVLVAERLRDGADALRLLPALGALAGLLVLTRPQQATLLAFLAPGLWGITRRPWGAWAPGAAAGAAVFAALVGLQAAAFAQGSGSWTLNAYAAGGEGFRWARPQLYTVLLSPHRGLLWMSPVVLPAAVALVRARDLPWPGRVLAAQSVAQIYVISCWSSPDQGDSFGARMWSESAAAVAFGLASLHRAGRLTRVVLGGAAALGVVWTNALLALYLKHQLSVSDTHLTVLAKVVDLLR